jgi:hypothetical protein
MNPKEQNDALLGERAQDPLHKLRAATAVEKASIAKRLRRYQRLTAKITAYQDGTGPAPSIAEFEQWKADVQVDVALRRLQAGLPGD